MTDGPDTDHDLVARAKEGDEAAFTLLMGRYKGPIINFIYRLIGDASEAEDIAQETFVRAYRNLHRFAVRGTRDKFSSWLYQLARNAAIDALRRKRRRPVQSLDDGLGREPLADGDPAQDATARERERAIAEAIAALPEEQRTAMALTVYQDLSTTETARIMKCSGKSVEARLYRARQFLRRRLAALME
jgi:RNA polymerase sigma-70 factor (ECF subfamily)